MVRRRRPARRGGAATAERGGDGAERCGGATARRVCRKARIGALIAQLRVGRCRLLGRGWPGHRADPLRDGGSRATRTARARGSRRRRRSPGARSECSAAACAATSTTSREQIPRSGGTRSAVSTAWNRPRSPVVTIPHEAATSPAGVSATYQAPRPAPNSARSSALARAAEVTVLGGARSRVARRRPGSRPRMPTAARPARRGSDPAVESSTSRLARAWATSSPGSATSPISDPRSYPRRLNSSVAAPVSPSVRSQRNVR